MSQKNIDDYLQDGIHGTKLPNQAERDRFLGNLRERIVFCLTIAEVMGKEGRVELEQFFQSHTSAKVYLNGAIAYSFVSDIRKLANEYEITCTSISDEEVETDIGLVLAYDHAVHKEAIFLEEIQSQVTEIKQADKPQKAKKSFFGRFKSFFRK